MIVRESGDIQTVWLNCPTHVCASETPRTPLEKRGTPSRLETLSVQPLTQAMTSPEGLIAAASPGPKSLLPSVVVGSPAIEKIVLRGSHGGAPLLVPSQMYFSSGEMWRSIA